MCSGGRGLCAWVLHVYSSASMSSHSAFCCLLLGSSHWFNPRPTHPSWHGILQLYGKYLGFHCSFSVIVPGGCCSQGCHGYPKCIWLDLSSCSTFLCHAQFPKLIYCWWVLQVLHVTAQMLDYFALWHGFPWLVCIFSSPCTSLFLRVIRGGNGLVDGPVIPENLEKAMKKIAEEGFAHKQQVHANLLYLVWYY